MSWQDRLGRLNEAGKSTLRRVGQVASEVAATGADNLGNVDLTAVAVTVGNVIQMADAGGMLNDPKAAYLKGVAVRLAAGEQVPPLELIELIPDVLQMDLARRVLPKNPMTDRTIKLMGAAVAVHRFGKAVRDANAPAPGGQTPPSPPEATDGREVA